MPLQYELHCHSCVSPCAENEMTPVTVCGLAKLAGIELLSITDHNSAANLPAAKLACDAYGLALLPGIEVTTAEEIHLLCYFPTVEAALEMGQQLYRLLPDIPCDARYFGEQLVMDEDDRIIDRPQKLLTNAAACNIARAKQMAEVLGGLAVPAHLDKDTTSVLSVLGFMPDEPVFPCVEMRHPEKADSLIASGRMPTPQEILVSSDAHQTDAIGSAGGQMQDPRRSYLWPLLKNIM